jgi:AcrR family transcriptional regulator
MVARPKPAAVTGAGASTDSTESASHSGSSDPSDASADPSAATADPSDGPRPLRRDARRNRERILAAARAAFAEHGLDVGVDEIARRAGVGMGTLYRRFPTKDALIEAILEDRLDEVIGLLERAVEGDDPWRAFEAFMHDIVFLQATDRGFKDILASRRRDEPKLSAARARMAPLLERLIADAQAAGQMRTDLDQRDVGPLLWGAGRVVESTADVAPDYWRRYLAIVLDGLRPPAVERDLPAPPLTDEQFAAAMHRFHGRTGQSAGGSQRTAS